MHNTVKRNSRTIMHENDSETDVTLRVDKTTDESLTFLAKYHNRTKKGQIKQLVCDEKIRVNRQKEIAS